MNSAKKKIYPEGTRRVACLGLSADPPHKGHLELARIILKEKAADEIWLIPCREHPFGKPMTEVCHRWRMAKLMEGPGIVAKDIELTRQGKSYTADTLLNLKEKYPDYRFFWVVGSDIVATGSFLRWKDWDKLLFFADFLVVPRPGYKPAKLPPGFTWAGSDPSTGSGSSRAKSRDEDEGKNISSSEIRERVRHGLSIDHLVPQGIKEYIEKHNLYKGS